LTTWRTTTALVSAAAGSDDITKAAMTEYELTATPSKKTPAKKCNLVSMDALP
jgi:hypothetical protein